MNVYPEIGSILCVNCQEKLQYIAAIQHFRRRETIAMTPFNSNYALEELVDKTHIELLPEATEIQKSEVEKIWERGETVIFDVDVIGGLNLKKIFGDNALSVFIQPPSYDELERRLRYRSTETEEKIQMRMAKANAELGYTSQFDKIIVNDDLEKAIQEAEHRKSNPPRPGASRRVDAYCALSHCSHCVLSPQKL